MKSIEIEDDVYGFLLSNALRIGENASEILRRLLGIPDPRRKTIKKVAQSSSVNQLNSHSFGETTHIQSEISDCFTNPAFQAQTSVIGKFLYILSYIYKRNPEHFGKILAISGRHRKYFTRTEKELEQSGSSVHPKQIPGTPYWVVTNTDTPKKRRMMEDVLKSSRLR